MTYAHIHKVYLVLKIMLITYYQYPENINGQEKPLTRADMGGTRLKRPLWRWLTPH